jgi:hypothetical protein
VIANRLGRRVMVLQGDGAGGVTGVRTELPLPASMMPSDLVAADFNGDGLPDAAVSARSSGEVVLWLGAGGLSFEEPVQRITGVTPGDLVVADVDGDGTLDLLTAHSNGATIDVWRFPSPGAWTQELYDPDVFVDGVGNPVPALPLVAGDTIVPLHQAPQLVDQIAVKVRVRHESAAILDQIAIYLQSPRGEEVLLDDGSAWAGQTLLQGHYREDNVSADLTALHGRQPRGDWIVRIDNAGTEVPLLEDVAVLTHGSYFSRTVGWQADVPRPLTFASGRTAAQALGTSTLGHPDSTGLSCATTGGTADGSGDGWHELTLPAANDLMEVRASADFDAVLELRQGTCASLGAVLACNDNGYATGRDPRLQWPGGLALGAGVYCIVVDGRYDDNASPGDPTDDVRHAGDYGLTVLTGAPVTP